MRYVSLLTALCAIIIFLGQGCVPTQDLDLANQAFKAGNLEQAYDQYQLVLQKSPGNQEALKAVSRIRKTLLDRATERIKTIAAASSSLSAYQLRENLTIFDASVTAAYCGVVTSKA